MIPRLLISIGFTIVIVNCCPTNLRTQKPTSKYSIEDLETKVVKDFERATLQGKELYWQLFDFVLVGVYEKLLRRHDLMGRLPHLSAAMRKSLAQDTPAPYPPAREKRNLGYFYAPLAQRTVGSGGCTAQIPTDHYSQLLGTLFPPLPPGNSGYETLRSTINPKIQNGGVIGIKCKGGTGGLALVFTRSDHPRGYKIITLYDDLGVAPTK